MKARSHLALAGDTVLGFLRWLIADGKLVMHRGYGGYRGRSGTGGNAAPTVLKEDLVGGARSWS